MRCLWLPAVLVVACGGRSKSASMPMPCAALEQPAVARELSTAELYRERGPTIVFVRTKHSKANTTTVTSGGGVLVDGAGRILTTCHQLRVDGALVDEVEVRFGALDHATHAFTPQAPISATIERCDIAIDLALLRVSLATTTTTKAVAPVVLANVGPRPGERVALLGPSLLGYLWTVHECVVAGVGDLVATNTEDLTHVTQGEHASDGIPDSRKSDLLQTSCFNNPMSGSAMFNARGELVGLNSFGRSRKADLEESEFYIGTNRIRAFINASTR